MKYIRTETEIYDTDDLYVCEKLKGKPYGVKNSYWVIYKENIVKEANTIEELCDKFVVEDNDDFAVFHNWELAKNTKGNVYGAIRTSKGLTYVAKMNENGELKLI